MEGVLLEIAKLTPVVGLLIAAIFYFLKREKKCQERIDTLNVDLRETEKENLTAMYKVTAVLDKVIDLEKGGNKMVIKEIEEMRKSIEEKLNDLNK